MDSDDDLLINGLVSAQWKRRALRMIQRLVVLSGDARPPLKAAGRGLAFWVVSDNLRKGAATNAVQIAEALVERGWVKAAAARNAAGSPA